MLKNIREREIEWGDCDAAGIVFYPRYFAMFDASTAYLFEKAFGMKKADWCRKFGIIGIPMVDTGAKFSIPSSYGEVIRIESEITALGKSSIDIAHTVWKGERAAITAHEVRVWTGRDPENPARLRAVAIPEEARRAFEGKRDGEAS